MEFRRRHQTPEPDPAVPRGVRIRHADGRVSECSLVRDPDDEDGCAQWLAMPPEGVEMDILTDRLDIYYLPPRTGVWLTVPVPPGGVVLDPGWPPN